ncbi:hypothetical protein OQA88_3533 [Cercophora sp. LCS_1]
MSRTYDSALSHLSLLQSNRAITALFTPTSPPANLNALAIPEMLAWLQRAGHTPSSLAATGLRCIHVAGTKGKGSVTTFAASILSQYPQCRPVGTYTSPHVVSVRERILINGAPISKELFSKYFWEVWDRLSEAARKEGDVDPDGPGSKPFYFRFLTIMALHVFVREGVKDAVVECGIGGEYDATNVLGGEMVSAAVVTRLGIDHVSMLGGTVEEIAWHKAGVLKAGVKGFVREAEEGVLEVIRERGREKGAEVEVVRGEVKVDGARLAGPWTGENMKLAVEAAREHLRKRGVVIEDVPEEFKTGLREAMLRGRCEVLRDSEIEWFVDGAHTVDSLEGVGRWFAEETKGNDAIRVLVFNQQERNTAALLGALFKGAKEGLGRDQIFSHAILARNDEQPAKDGEQRDLAIQAGAKELILTLSQGTLASVHDSVPSAVEKVRAIAAQAQEDGK